MNELDVSYLPVKRLWTRRQGVAGFVTMLALTSYDEIEKGMGFDSSDVCLMVNVEHHVWACQSLAYQATLVLYCALVPPLSNLELVISMISVCDLDSVRAVYRRGRS